MRLDPQSSKDWLAKQLHRTAAKPTVFADAFRLSSTGLSVFGLESAVGELRR